MANKSYRPFRITLDLWLARFGSVFGWVWMIFWIVPGVYGLFEVILGKAETTADFVMPWICFGLAFPHYLIIRSARKTRALIADFRVYCAVFAQEPDKSIPEAAKALKEPVETVFRQLKEMCGRGYFNGYIDHRTQRMVFPGCEQEQTGGGVTVVHCPGCGAPNAVSSGGGACRYCDAPLFAPHCQHA